MDRYERVWTLETYSLNFSFDIVLGTLDAAPQAERHDRCEDQKPGLENFVLIVLRPVTSSRVNTGVIRKVMPRTISWLDDIEDTGLKRAAV